MYRLGQRTTKNCEDLIWEVVSLCRCTQMDVLFVGSCRPNFMSSKHRVESRQSKWLWEMFIAPHERKALLFYRDSLQCVYSKGVAKNKERRFQGGEDFD